mmetsp:Transcript_741/g.1155  ORF Transcript_741/g.1155 Transcript_741/m.1155 type:complete len:84 (+) Transcript_741:401-652(+)
MARKTKTTSSRKNKNKPRTSTTFQSAASRNSFKGSDQENVSTIHARDSIECEDGGICDCILRKGQMFLPPNLRENSDSFEQKR